jgi:hypothetical protein
VVSAAGSAKPTSRQLGDALEAEIWWDNPEWVREGRMQRNLMVHVQTPYWPFGERAVYEVRLRAHSMSETLR